jgi:hypothetical protein
MRLRVLWEVGAWMFIVTMTRIPAGRTSTGMVSVKPRSSTCCVILGKTDLVAMINHMSSVRQIPGVTSVSSTSPTSLASVFSWSRRTSYGVKRSRLIAGEREESDE